MIVGRDRRRDIPVADIARGPLGHVCTEGQ